MNAGWTLRLLLAAATCGVGFVAGYRLAVPDCICPGCPDSDPHSIPVQPQNATRSVDPPLPPPARSAPGPACDLSELVRARKELRRLKVAKDLSREMPADRPPDPVDDSAEWEEAPYQYHEAGFSKIIAQAALELEDRVEMVGVDCRQMPCMAVLMARIPETPSSSIRNTQAWKEHFGTGGRSYNALIDCKDGRKEQIEIASPFWVEKHDPLRMESEDIARVVEDTRRSRTEKQESQETVRMANRWREIRMRWICRPPAGPED